MIYFDTAYLAKCYLTDYGYATVRHTAEQADAIACCALGRVELAAAIHRALREKRLSRRDFNVVCEQFAQDDAANCWVWFPVTNRLLERAAKELQVLAPTVPLRAVDALHLACAAEHGFQEIYSNDRHLLAAAAHFGIRGVDVIPPRL